MSFKWESRHTVTTAHLSAWSFVWFCRILIAVAFIQMIPELHMTYEDAGTSISLLTWTWAIAALFAGPLSDRYGRKRLIIISVLLFSLFSWTTGLSDSVLTLFGMRGLEGLGEGLYFPTATALIASIWPPQRRGHAIGVHHMGAAVGTFAAEFFGVTLILMVGWRMAFYLSAIPGVIIALIIFMVTREPPKVGPESAQAPTPAVASTANLGVADPPEPEDLKQPEKVGLWQAWKTSATCKPHNVPWLCVIFITSLAALYIIIGFLTLELTNIRGFSPDQAGILGALFAFSGIFGYYFPSRWSDKTGRKPMLFLLFGGAAIMQLIFWVLPASAPFYAVAAVLLLAGFFTWGSFPLTAAVMASESVPGWVRATPMGMIVFVGEFLNPFVGTYLAGYVADWYGLQMVFAMTVPLSVASFLLVFALKETSLTKSKPGVRWS